MANTVKGKVVLITGGSSGIGRALGVSFGKRGARIAFSGRSKVRIEETESLYNQLGISYQSFISDATSRVENEQLIANVISTYGHLDILIANAGIVMWGQIGELSLETFRKVVETNFFGTVYAVKYALPYLLETKGSVIAVSSTSGYRSAPRLSAYGASKAAMQMFAEALRMEHWKKLHVLVVCPGLTESNLLKDATLSENRVLGSLPKSSYQEMSSERVAEATYRSYRKKHKRLVLPFRSRFLVWFTRCFPNWAEYVVVMYLSRVLGRQGLEK